MSLVVDASVALRWYVRAPGSEAAAGLLDLDDPLIAPDLVVAEVSNAARKLARAGEISEEHGERIVAAIPSAFASLEPSAGLANRAFALARELDHPVYDCLYLALAEREETHVLTTDRRLLGKVDGTKRDRLVRALGAG